MTIALCIAAFPATAAPTPPSPDQSAIHLKAGFPLTDGHRTVNCSSCHRNGVFKGTPKSCSSCHNGVSAPGKSANHIASSTTCKDCHTTARWSDATFNHGSVRGTCASCHNGRTAAGKGARHMLTTSDCAQCHSTQNWNATRFDHAGVTGNCASCHNGSKATGKGAKHIATSGSCETCHTSTSSWSAINFSHSGSRAPARVATMERRRPAKTRRTWPRQQLAIRATSRPAAGVR
jgi:hypothetical protein